MDDLMARTMVENLSVGIDPITGKLLSQDDSCANELVQEAIRTVLDHCSIDSHAIHLERQRKEKKEEADKRKKQERSVIPIKENPRPNEKKESFLFSTKMDTTFPILLIF